MRELFRTSVPTLIVSACAAFVMAFAPGALAFSNNPAQLVGKTNKSGGAGCGNGCHSDTAGTAPDFVAINGVNSLAAGASSTYTVFAQKGTTAGVKMGVAIAASDTGTPLSVTSGMPTALTSGEIIHDSNVGALRTTTNGLASYQFTYTMPASATPGSTHTLYAVAALGFPGGWAHAPNLVVTTSGTTPPPPAATSGISMLDPAVTQVVEGQYHSCALTASGGVKCWGDNRSGQLGDTTFSNTFRSTARDVTGLTSGVVALAAGGDHTCALMTNGTVKCWGRGNNGELGNNASSESTSPVDVTGLTSVAAIAAGFSHTCALTTGGLVKCWGRNDSGQLGNGLNTNSSSPVEVAGLTGAVALATGYYHSCAIVTGGGAKCWGKGDNGQLGDNTFASKSTAVDVSGLTNARVLAAGEFHTCAVTTTNGAKCWGGNDRGQIGDGAVLTNRPTPTDVSGLTTTAATISAGSEHTCVVTTTGGAKCWGFNNSGQLGNGTASQSNTPADVKDVGGSGTLAGVASISSGSFHNCTLNALDGVKCWGHDEFGQVGNGGNGGAGQKQQSPVDVTGLALGVTAFDADFGASHACAVTPGGGVKCWGRNDVGQLGDGTTINRSAPVDVLGFQGVGLLANIKSVATGNQHTCALTRSGEVLCWGFNDNGGRLGDNTTSATPQLFPKNSVMYEFTSNNFQTLTGVSALAAGEKFTCAIKGGPQVYCWGDNSSGQLGNNSTTSSAFAVPVSGGISPAEIALGGDHACARSIGGTTSCWGRNSNGQIGDGTTGINRLTPVTIAGLTSTALGAGDKHSCAVTASGTKCWGRNSDGQLGDNSTTDRSAPFDVSTLGAGVAVALTGGNSHTCARTTAGAMKCWGSNATGELGDGSATKRLTPVNVSGISSDVADITAGNGFSCALVSATSAGVPASAARVLRCWGTNTVGQLGDGSQTDRMVPVNIRRAQSITAFTPPNPVSTGSLSATAGSGMSVVFDTWTPNICTVSGNTVTVSTTGLCGLRASQAGDGGYNAPAPQQLRLLSAVYKPTLSVIKAGTGTGTVISVPGGSGINCGSTCSFAFDLNSAVTLQAAADSGSTFTGWSPSTVCIGAGNCSLTMNGDKSVTATFTLIPPNQFALTVTKDGTGTGTVASTPTGINCGSSCSAFFNQGSTVTLTATPDSGSTFTKWGGACTGTATTCQVPIDQTKNVTATFGGAVTGELIIRYRAYSPITFEHLSTADFFEYQYLTNQIDSACCGWKAEGAIYRVFKGAGSFGGVTAVPYYRLYNPFSLQHHWTTDKGEYDFLKTVGWIQEGIDGYILPTSAAGSLPLYRLYLNAKGGLHLWTTDKFERDYLIANASWVDEGIAGYVIPLP